MRGGDFDGALGALALAAERGAKFPSSALPKKKTTSLPNPRSLVGVPVLLRVGKYRTKEGRKKITHVPSVLAVGVKLVTSPCSAILLARFLAY